MKISKPFRSTIVPVLRLLGVSKLFYWLWRSKTSALRPVRLWKWKSAPCPALAFEWSPNDATLAAQLGPLDDEAQISLEGSLQFLFMTLVTGLLVSSPS